jgi:sarcosine oxidase
MTCSRKADVLVVGLGAMGSATCFQLASVGVPVIGIDQYVPPHPYGSTHGDTRLTRLAVGEGQEYVRLVRRSHELWREIEVQAGARLLTQTGGVLLSHPSSSFCGQTRALARRFGIDHELLSNAQVHARFPTFALDERTEGYHEPDAGYVRPEAAVRTQLGLARRHGAQLRLGERVTAWSASARGVIVTTDQGAYEAQHLILCAGPWLPQLFPEGSAHFAVRRQLLHWFPILEGYEQLRDMPVFVCEFGGDRPGFVHLNGFYGFPALDGPSGGMKLATESYESMTTPDGRQHPATPAESAQLYRDYVQTRLRWLGPDPVRTVSCLYTSTPANRVVIDRHPGHDTVLIVSPCSGHGFKHSAAIGEAVAQWVTRGTTDIDLSPFRVSQAGR